MQQQEIRYPWIGRIISYTITEGETYLTVEYTNHRGERKQQKILTPQYNLLGEKTPIGKKVELECTNKGKIVIVGIEL